MIYLDNSATSFYKPQQVKNAVVNAINNLTANPGRSAHKPSQQVDALVYETRERLKNFFNAPNHNVVFTKNCTEAINLAILGIVKTGDHIITTCYEHNSVLRTLNKMEQNDVEVTILNASIENFAHEVETKIKSNTKMIITTYISNVTGEECDVKKVGKICKRHNIIYLVDAAQACGHTRVDLMQSNIDMLAFSGHKGLLALTGVGGLMVKKGLTLQPLLCGGTGTESESLVQPTDYPEGYESGTLPTMSIVSLNEGVEFLQRNFNEILKKEELLTKYLIKKLKVSNFIKIYSTEKSKNVVSFNVDGLDSTLVANLLDEKFNICVRPGLHCAPQVHKRLGTLKTGAVRASLDFNNTFEEIDKLIVALTKIFEFQFGNDFAGNTH